MRTVLAAALSLALAGSALAEPTAQGGRAANRPRAAAPAPPARSPAPARPGGPRAAAPGVHPTYPAPPPGAPRYRYPYRYYPYGAYAFPYYYPYYTAPFWWGWGWGWGYYPLYPRPAYPYREEEARRITTEVTVTGGPTRAYWSGIRSNEVAGGVEVLADGPRFGFGAAVDGFNLGSSYTGLGSSSALALGSLHATFAIASGEFGRLRAELGGSVVSWPDTINYLGATSLGPDVGLSGHVGLIGPLGIEGHARYTPFPRYVVDFEGSLAIRLGPVALKGGWREVAVGGDSVQPSLRFSGPQIGLSFLF